MSPMSRRSKRNMHEVNPLGDQNKDALESWHYQKDHVPREEEGKVERAGKGEEKRKRRTRYVYNRRMHILMLCILFLYFCLSVFAVFCVIRLLLTGLGFFSNLIAIMSQIANMLLTFFCTFPHFFFLSFMYRNAGGHPELRTRTINTELENPWIYEDQEAAEYNGNCRYPDNFASGIFIAAFMILQWRLQSRYASRSAPFPVVLFPFAVVLFHYIYYTQKKWVQYNLITRICKIVLLWMRKCSGLGTVMVVHWALVFSYFLVMSIVCFSSALPPGLLFFMFAHTFWTGLMVQLSGTVIGFIWSNEFVAGGRGCIKGNPGRNLTREEKMETSESVVSILHRIVQLYLYLFRHIHRLCSVSLFFFPMVFFGVLKDFHSGYLKKKNVLWAGPGPNGEPEGRPVPRRTNRRNVSAFDRAEAACLYCILEGDIYQVWKRGHRARYGSMYWIVCRVLPGWCTLFNSVAKFSALLPFYFFVYIVCIIIPQISKIDYTGGDSGLAHNLKLLMAIKNVQAEERKKWCKTTSGLVFFYLCTWFFSFAAAGSTTSILFGSFKALFMLRDNFIEDRKKTAEHLFEYVMEETYKALKYPMQAACTNLWEEEIHNYSALQNDRDFLDRVANI